MENNFTLSDYTKAISTIEKIENLRKAAKEANDKYDEAEEKIHKAECSIAERDEFLKCYEEERIADRKLLRAMRSFNRKYERFCTLRLSATQKEDEIWADDLYANTAMNIANDFAQYMINYRFTK